MKGPRTSLQELIKIVNNSDGDENNGTLYNTIPNCKNLLHNYARYAGRYSEKDMLSLI